MTQNNNDNKKLGDFLLSKFGGRIHRSPTIDDMKKAFRGPNEDLKDDQKIVLWNALSNGPIEGFLIDGFPRGKVNEFNVRNLIFNFYESNNFSQMVVPQKALNSIQRYHVEVCQFEPGEMDDDPLVRVYAFRGPIYQRLTKLRVGAVPGNPRIVLTGEVWDLEKLLS